MARQQLLSRENRPTAFVQVMLHENRAFLGLEMLAFAANPVARSRNAMGKIDTAL